MFEFGKEVMAAFEYQEIYNQNKCIDKEISGFKGLFIGLVFSIPVWGLILYGIFQFFVSQ